MPKKIFFVGEFAWSLLRTTIITSNLIKNNSIKDNFTYSLLITKLKATGSNEVKTKI